MTVSSQIIEVINDLCAKFGIVIDWSAETVVPMLQTLAEKYIHWEIATSIAWIVILFVTTLILVVLWLCAIKWWSSDARFFFGLSAFISLAFLIGVAGCQSFDIIEATLFPEKTIFEFVQTAINSK